jgi:hypothetical protein
MKQIYSAPDFDVSVYEVEDIITLSIGTGPVDGGDSGWIDV